MEQTTTSSQKETLPAGYQNNPFFVATDGLERLFKKAKSVGIFLAIICALSLSTSLPGSIFPPVGVQNDTQSSQTSKNSTSGGVSTSPQNSDSSAGAKENEEFTNFVKSIPASVWVLIGIIALLVFVFFIVFGIVVKGVGDFTAARLAEGKKATLGEALRGVFGQFWGYTWVLVIVGVKTFLWSLLFIIPGVIMAIRYSLSGVSFFATDNKGNAAVRDSLALTRGALLTTFASQALLNIITFGLVANLLEPGTNSVLYRQYRTLTDKSDAKPKPHLLSKITFGLLVFVVFIICLLLVALVYAALNYANTAP